MFDLQVNRVIQNQKKKVVPKEINCIQPIEDSIQGKPASLSIRKIEHQRALIADGICSIQLYYPL